MKSMKLFVALFVVALLALVAGAFAKEELGPYQLLTTISIPGNLSGGFDISWVDSASERYYLSERTTVKGGGRIDVIDAEQDKISVFHRRLSRKPGEPV